MSKTPYLIQVEKTVTPKTRKSEVQSFKQLNGILTHHCASMTEWIAIIPVDEDKGKDIATIFAESCRLYDEANMIGYGKTERSAIICLCRTIGKQCDFVK